MDNYLRSRRLSITQLQFAALGFVSYQNQYAILRHVQVKQIKIYHVTCQAGVEGRRRFRSYLFQTLALDAVGGQPHAPAALSPGMRPGTHCTGGWVGHRVGMDSC
jgi:hypothetical protein